MKLNSDLSEEKLKEALKDNQELLIVLVVLGIAIMLFVVFVLPNILSFPTKVSERNVEVEKLNQIKSAKKVLETTNQNVLEQDLEVATRALPSDKNFELILGSISEAATRSNTIITGYEFATRPNSAQIEQGGFPGLEFEISLAGGVDRAADFVRELSMSYPISEAKEISYERGISTVTISFYYKPFTEVEAKDVALAREKTEGEKKALEEISNWNYFSIEQNFFQQFATESAQTDSPF